MKLAETHITQSEVNSKHPLLLTDDNGDAVAAVIPIEDLYLLQKLDDCLKASRPSSRFRSALKRL